MIISGFQKWIPALLSFLTQKRVEKTDSRVIYATFSLYRLFLTITTTICFFGRLLTRLCFCKEINENL